MMGFGFVVARLVPNHHVTLAPLVGTALAILGGVVNVAATVKYRAQVRHVRAGRDPVPDVIMPTAIGAGSAVIAMVLVFALLR